jgi:hypothetical protein
MFLIRRELRTGSRWGACVQRQGNHTCGVVGGDIQETAFGEGGEGAGSILDGLKRYQKYVSGRFDDRGGRRVLLSVTNILAKRR